MPSRQSMMRYRRAPRGTTVGLGQGDDAPGLRRDFYVYEAAALALASGASANDTIQIEANSDFWLQKLTYQADIAAAAFLSSTRPIPNVTLQITDSGSARQLMNNPIPIPSFFGTGELPFILPNPRKFEKNTVIQLAFTNFDAAVAYNVRLAFIGYKIYEI